MCQESRLRYVLPMLVMIMMAGVAEAQAKSAKSPTCVEAVGQTQTDLDRALSFCQQGILKGVVEGVIAQQSILIVKVPRATADAMLADRLQAEQLVKTWMRGWRFNTKATSVTVTVEWQDVEIAEGQTTLTHGDVVTFRR